MKSKSRSILLTLLGLSLGLWLALATLVVPAIIESAYHGKSWRITNSMIQGQGIHPLSHYLQDWNQFTLKSLLVWLAVWVLAFVVTSPSFTRSFLIRERLAALSRRSGNIYKATAILVLNAIVMLVVLDFAATSALKIWNVFSDPAELLDPEPREKSSFYSSVDWGKQFWHEFRLSRKVQYRPYVLWRRAPLKGETININRDGVRLTPGADCTATSYRVFMFGASTVWGTGSPDWGTIPAFLQSGLQALKDGPVCVVNFGESGWVSTQGLIELIRQLESGNYPDLVLFYDGATDVYSAYQSGQAGVHQNLETIAATLTGQKGPHPVVEWIKGFPLFSFVKRLVVTVKAQPTTELITYASKGIKADALSRDIVDSDLANYRVVSALAQEYGFQYFFFWSPVIAVGEKPLTSEEQEINRNIEPALRMLYESVYRAMERAALDHDHLYYIAPIFNDCHSLIWLDETHTTLVGHQLIAEKILEVITREPL